MKILLYSLFIWTVMIKSVQSQTVSKSSGDKLNLDWTERVYTGGNLGLQFGALTFIDVSPLVGVKVTDRLSLGVRGIYQYINFNQTNWDSHVFGGALFSRFFFLEGLFAHAEYEVLNAEWDPRGGRSNIPSLLVGPGYMYRIGDNAGLSIMALWNFINTPNSPYPNPLIKGGFVIGF